MRTIVVGAALALLVGSITFAAGNKCDSGIEKATGKKVACACGIIAKGGTDTSKCTTKFSKACAKAKKAGGCLVQTASCAQKEAEVDAFVTQHCLGSPNGAFLQ
jgi:hydrogenase maturation factor